MNRFLRRSVKLLPPEARLKQFGSYELILPTELALKDSPQLQVPHSIHRPDYVVSNAKPLDQMGAVHINTAAEIEGIRKACRVAKQVLDKACEFAKPNLTTLDIDMLVHRLIVEANAYPSPLGYNGFPRSCCTSVNNVICHGIPNNRMLQEGDIVNIDITVYLNGFHGDTSRTVMIGDVDAKGVSLVTCTRHCLEEAMRCCKPGSHFRDIGKAISSIAERNGYTVSPDFCGHGIGRHFHQPPLVLHHRNNSPARMQPGMVFTIEPILCQGSSQYLKWPDGWTVVTRDGGRAAQFEHTLLMLDDGLEILT